MTCPATRLRPKTRGSGAPSLDPMTRKRSTRPVSTGAEPSPSSRWSSAGPTIAPAALPSASGRARRSIRRRRRPAPSRQQTATASPSAYSCRESGRPRRSAATRPASAAIPPRRARNRHGSAWRARAATARGCPRAWRRRRRACAAPRCPPAAPPLPEPRPDAARPPPAGPPSGSAPTSRAYSSAPPPAPARAARANPAQEAQAVGSGPPAARLVPVGRADPGPRPRDDPSPRAPQVCCRLAPSWIAPFLGIGRHPVVARDVREAAEIEEVVELRPAGLGALVAAGDDAEPVARRGPAPRLLPERRAVRAPGPGRSDLIAADLAGVGARRARSAPHA